MAIRTIAIIQGHYFALRGLGHSHGITDTYVNGFGWFYDLAGFEVFAGVRDIFGLGSWARSRSQPSYNSVLDLDMESSGSALMRHYAPTSSFGRCSTVGKRALVDGGMKGSATTTRPIDIHGFGTEEDYQYQEQDRDSELECYSVSFDTSLSSADFDPPQALPFDYYASLSRDENMKACGIGLGISGLRSKDGTTPFTGLGVISVRPFGWRHVPPPPPTPSSSDGDDDAITSISSASFTASTALDFDTGDGEWNTSKPERFYGRYYYGPAHVQSYPEVDLETGLYHPDEIGLFEHSTAEESAHTRIEIQTLEVIPEYDCDPWSPTSASSLSLSSNTGVLQRPRLTETDTDTGMEMETTPTQRPMLTPIINTTHTSSPVSSRCQGDDIGRRRTSFPSARPMKGFAAPTISSELKRKGSIAASISNLVVSNAYRGQRHRHRLSGSVGLDATTKTNLSLRFFDSSGLGDYDRENKPLDPLDSRSVSNRTPTNIKTAYTTSIRQKAFSLAGVGDLSTNSVSPKTVPRWR